MLYIYLKIAFRNLLKNRTASFINIGGLGLGLAMSLLILLFVLHELSFDKFHQHQATIFQAQGLVKMGEMEFNFFNMSERTGDVLKENSESVLDVGRKTSHDDGIFETTPQHRFKEEKVMFADEGFFRVFSFKVLRGDIAAMREPFTVFLTPEMAQKYFGSDNPVGKTLTWDKKYPLTVRGLVAPAPSNSSIAYNFILSAPTLLSVNKEQYPQYFTDTKLDKVGSGMYETFVRLRDLEQRADVEQLFRTLAAQYPDNEKVTYALDHYAAISHVAKK